RGGPHSVTSCHKKSQLPAGACLAASYPGRICPGRPVYRRPARWSRKLGWTMAEAGEAGTARSGGGKPHGREIVFIDRGVRGHAWLARRVRPGVEAVLLDAEAPALRQIAGHLRGRDGVSAVHVVTHGAPGRLGFAAGDVDAATLAAPMPRRSPSAAAGGGILLWACDVAADAGARLVAALSA